MISHVLYVLWVFEMFHPTNIQKDFNTNYFKRMGPVFEKVWKSLLFPHFFNGFSQEMQTKAQVENMQMFTAVSI